MLSFTEKKIFLASINLSFIFINGRLYIIRQDMRRIFFIIIIFLVMPLLASSMNGTKGAVRYGGFIHYGYNIHYPNFNKLPGVPNCCPNFREGSGSGIYFGGLFDYFLSNELLLSGRLSFHTLSGQIIDKDETKVLVNDIITDGEFEHTIDASLYKIAVEPMIGAELFDNFIMFFGFAPGFMVVTDFEQAENLTKPENSGVFDDTKTRVRNDTSGVIPKASFFNMAFSFGVTYELPLNNSSSWIAAPEIFYDYGFSDLSSAVQWKVSTLRAGVAIKYNPAPKAELHEDYRKELEIDTISIKSQILAEDRIIEGVPFLRNSVETMEGDIKVYIDYFMRIDTLYVAMLEKTAEPAATISDYRIYSGDRSEDEVRIYVKQQFVTQAFSLLPFVYFPHNSTDIPKRYKLLESPVGFNVDALEVNPVVYHLNIMNIIGSRLIKYPDTKITLYGFSDAETEDADCELAKARAEKVKEYFVNTWGIDPERINIDDKRNRCSPIDYTKTPNEYGYSENRRVKIHSDDKRILAPLDKKRFLETVTISPLSLVHDPQGEKMDSVKNWFLTGTQGGEIQLFSDAGIGRPGLIEQEITVNQANKMVSGVPLGFNLSVNNEGGKSDNAKYEVPVRKDTSDVEVERLSLAIFRVSENALRDVDKKAITNFLKGLKSTDTVKVTGYTDMLGSPDENAALSQRRANIVCDFIKTLPEVQQFGLDIVRCKGVGFALKPPQIMSYESPEERFLSRTVQIEIRKKWR